MLRSSGALEKMPRSELESIYRFCRGAHAPPLPDDHKLAVLFVLRGIAQQRQPVPDQPSPRVGDWLRLPYLGFVRQVGKGTLAGRVLQRQKLGKRPLNVGDLAQALEVNTGSIMQALFALHRAGYGVTEDEITGEIVIHKEPLPFRHEAHRLPPYAD
jgi:hypothetical protein